MSGSNPPAWRSVPPGTPSVIPPPGAPSVGLAAGAALVLAGTIELRSPANRKSGTLLVAAGTAWLITAWDNPAAPTWIFVAGRILDTVWPVLMAHALLTRYGALGRAERAVLVIAYACTICLDLAVSLVSDPATLGRRLPG